MCPFGGMIRSASRQQVARRAAIVSAGWPNKWSALRRRPARAADHWPAAPISASNRQLLPPAPRGLDLRARPRLVGRKCDAKIDAEATTLAPATCCGGEERQVALCSRADSMALARPFK